MKEAIFSYKCRQCSKLFDGCRIGPEYALMHLTAAVLDAKTIGSDVRAVDRMTVHYCDETRVGLADLVGYRTEGVD